MTWEARAGRVVAGQPRPAMTHPFLLPPAPNVTCPQQPETRSTRNPFCGTSHWQVALQSRGGGGWGSQPHLARCRGARRPSASLEHKPLGSSDAGNQFCCCGHTWGCTPLIRRREIWKFLLQRSSRGTYVPRKAGLWQV